MKTKGELCSHLQPYYLHNNICKYIIKQRALSSSVPSVLIQGEFVIYLFTKLQRAAVSTRRAILTAQKLF